MTGDHDRHEYAIEALQAARELRKRGRMPAGDPAVTEAVVHLLDEIDGVLSLRESHDPVPVPFAAIERPMTAIVGASSATR